MIKDNKNDSDRSNSTGSWVEFSNDINWLATKERAAVSDLPSSTKENLDKTEKKLKNQRGKEENGIFATRIYSTGSTRRNLVDQGDLQPSPGRRPGESPFANFDEEQQDAARVGDAASTPSVAASELMRGEHYVCPGAFHLPGPEQDQDDETHDDIDHTPGAHAVPGILATSHSSAEQVSPMPETVTTVQDPDSLNLVSAHLVDTEEEARRMQQLEEQNRMLQELEENVAVANVVTKGEILKSFFNLRDPEFRRQRICGFGFLVIVLAAIAVSIVLTRGDDVSTAPTPPQTPPPTPEPTTQVHKRLSEFLSEFSFDDGAALFNQSTPQYQAVKWLANDTNIDRYDEMQIVQRYALATFYFSTGGDNWTKNDLWLDDGPECGRWWQALATTNLLCTDQDKVKAITLNSNGLKGKIPPELVFLSNSLERISLRENDMTGAIPTELALLTVLSNFDVDQNRLSGTIMTELGLMTNLSFLGMAQNKFTGTITTELFLLTNLLTLTLGSHLQGTISTDIGSLTRLTDLGLYLNELTGSIPSTIGLLARLTDLSLWTNQLSGTIPSTLGLLSSLVYLYIGDNSLVGKIPSEIQNLTKLKALMFDFNFLSGTIPSTIGLQTNLELLWLNGNNFTGSIPSELGALSSVKRFLLGENSLIGTIPSEVALLSSAQVFFLNRNSLIGNIPNDIGGLTNLVQLSLIENELTGTVPAGIYNMTSLERLWLYGNNLTGPFTCPVDVADCKISCESTDETCRVL